MQAAAHNGKYDIVRQAGMDLVKIHHDFENEKPPQPMVPKSASPLDYQQFPPKPLRSHSQPAPQSPSPLNYQPLPPQPLNPSPLTQNPASSLNSQQFPPNPRRSPFQLAQKCAPPARRGAQISPKTPFSAQKPTKPNQKHLSIPPHTAGDKGKMTDNLDVKSFNPRPHTAGDM